MTDDDGRQSFRTAAGRGRYLGNKCIVCPDADRRCDSGERAMKFLASIFILLLALMGHAHAFPRAGRANPTPTAETVTANLARTTTVIPSNFIGFSAEMQDVIADTIYTGSNTSLISLMGMLGKCGTFRMGGADSMPSAPALTTRIVRDVYNFLGGLGSCWQKNVIYGLDLKINNSATAVRQAGYLISQFGVNNVTFQIGDEPDLYLSSTTYGTNWNTYYSALIGVNASTKFMSPDTANLGSDYGNFVNATTLGKTGMQAVTTHVYCYNNPAFFPANYAAYIACADSGKFSVLTTYSSKAAITEGSGIANGGFQTYTDRLVQSTWYLHTVMDEIASGILFHAYHQVLTPWSEWGGRLADYNAVAKQNDGNWSPTPVFYGMYLLSQIVGQTQVATTKSGTGDVSALSTVGTGGKANILISNNDPNYPVTITPGQSTAWSTAKVLIVAPGSTKGCADNAPTLGGAAIGESGSWSGAPITISSGGTFTLQPCGAALVQIQSRPGKISKLCAGRKGCRWRTTRARSCAVTSRGYASCASRSARLNKDGCANSRRALPPKARTR